jgi:hypothetical protein
MAEGFSRAFLLSGVSPGAITEVLGPDVHTTFLLSGVSPGPITEVLVKDRLCDQRGGSEWEPIKNLLKELGLCPNRNSKSHIPTPITKTT